jgi:hypothetical protein
MITIIQIFVFLKVLLLFMSILNSGKEAFRLYKSLKLEQSFTMPKGGLLLLGLSVSYILAMIFV